MDLDQRIAELTQKMLRPKLYAVLSQPSSAPEKLKPLLPAHLEYMIGLEKRGVLFASGPLSDGGAGPPNGAGLTILRAAERRRRRARLPRLIRSSPTGCAPSSSRNGPSWRARCGLKINLSDQSIEVA